MHAARTWVLLAAATAAATWLVDRTGLPSPALFAGLLAGLVGSLAFGVRRAPAAPVVLGSQALLGVALGAYVQASTLSTLAGHALPVLLVSVATLVLTTGAGVGLARLTGTDRPTAAFGMIAGGAAGIISIARDLGADDRLVAVMQYLRVIVVIALTPPIAALLFSSPGGGSAVADVAPAWGDTLLLVAASLPAGLLLARWTRLPAGALLGPLIVAAVLSGAGVPFATQVPDALESVTFAIIGLEVGLRFTRGTVRAAGRILAPALLFTLLQIVACGALGVAIAPLVDVSALDGYLATTPGGIYASLGVAVDSGSNTTFVLAMQVLRVLLMLLAAPLLARLLVTRHGARGPAVAADALPRTAD